MNTGVIKSFVFLPLALAEVGLRTGGEVLGAVRHKSFWGYDYRVWLKRDLADCDSILELGCGSNSPILQIGYGPKTTAIDIFQPYIDLHNRQGDYRFCDRCDILQYNFPEKAFDAVVIFDVMEHLPREAAKCLFDRMERAARKKVIIFTPNGYTPNDRVDGNLYQEHVSAWEPEDYKAHGYKVTGTHGWRWIYGKAGLAIRKPYSFWTIIGMLSLPFMVDRPEWAAHSYAVKEL